MSHTTEECSLRRNANEIICFRCGNTGHRAYECPKIYQKGFLQQNWRQQAAEPPANTTVGVNGASNGRQTINQKDGPSSGSGRKPRQIVKSVDVNCKPPRVKIKIGSIEVQALFDSGAGKSLIRTDLFQKLGRDVWIFTPEVAVEFYDINNRRLSTRGTISVSF